MQTGIGDFSSGIRPGASGLSVCSECVGLFRLKSRFFLAKAAGNGAQLDLFQRQKEFMIQGFIFVMDLIWWSDHQS